MEKQNITLHLYDTTIPVSVPKEDEQDWREAGALINDRLNSYFDNYKGLKGDKEIMYYAMIDIALRCVKANKRNDVSPITSVLDELSKEIKAVLKK